MPIPLTRGDGSIELTERDLRDIIKIKHKERLETGRSKMPRQARIKAVREYIMRLGEQFG